MIAMVRAKRHHDSADCHDGRGQPGEPEDRKPAPVQRYSPSCPELGFPPLTYRNQTLSLCSVSVGFVVDIAGISGKLLLSPAPGLASRTGRLVRFGLRHGEGARIQPPSWLGVVPKGAAALIRLDGGWAWKGPGHPVDNGDQARCQRDGLRSEGAARVLFLIRRPLLLPRGAATARSSHRTEQSRTRLGHESQRQFVVF